MENRSAKIIPLFGDQKATANTIEPATPNNQNAPRTIITYVSVPNSQRVELSKQVNAAMAKTPSKTAGDVSWSAISLIVGICMTAVTVIGGFIVYDLHGVRSEMKVLNDTVTDIRIEAVKTNSKLDQIAQELQKP